MADKSKGVGSDKKTAASGNSGATGKTYIIAIGIDNYKQEKLKLESCTNDCKGFIKILQEKYEGFEVFRELYDEQATQDNVLSVIDDFCDSDKSNKNSPLNNLIVFFSGHGGFIEAPKQQIGCWIPYEYTDNPKKQFLRFSKVLEQLEFAIVRHLLVISDSCFSGALYKESDFFIQSNNPVGAAALDYEPSRWGLTSGRSNEKAIAGKAGELSAFTKELIHILTVNSDAELFFSQVASELKKIFSNNKVQRVDCKQLNIIPDNTGEFIFRAKADQLIRFKKNAYLQSELTTLNYTVQKTAFSNFSDRLSKTLVIFSGTEDCGLRHLSFLARSSESFSENTPLCWITAPVGLEVDGMLRNIFTEFLKKGPYSKDEEIKKDLFPVLKVNPVVIELRIYNTPDPEGNPSMMPEMKQDIINKFACFANQVFREGYFPLSIFIVDEENVDYDALYSSQPEVAVNTAIKPAIIPKPSKIAKSDILVWYNDIISRYKRAAEVEKLKEFKTFFDETIYQKADVIVTSTQGSPGTCIRTICNNANCAEAANILLDPKN